MDLLLRTFRFSMLGVAAAAAEIRSRVGPAHGLLLLGSRILIRSWSFRVSVCGSALSWNVLAGRTGSADPATSGLRVFAGKGAAGVLVRSPGRLEEGRVAGSSAGGRGSCCRRAGSCSDRCATWGWLRDHVTGSETAEPASTG